MTTAPQRRHAERPLYMLAAMLALAIVFAGFARSFFLKAAFDPSPMTPLVAVHGVVMSGWFVLFLVQSWLAAGNHLALHRRLGLLGMAWAVAVLVLGTITAITAARLGRGPPGAPPPQVFLIVPLGDMLVFACLVGAGLYWRKRSDYHKRLMLLASVGMLTAAIARIPLDAWARLGIPAYFVATSLLVVLCIVWDSLRNRRLHPAFVAGGLFTILSWPLRLALAGTEAWQGFARWLIG